MRVFRSFLIQQGLSIFLLPQGLVALSLALIDLRECIYADYCAQFVSYVREISGENVTNSNCVTQYQMCNRFVYIMYNIWNKLILCKLYAIYVRNFFQIEREKISSIKYIMI